MQWAVDEVLTYPLPGAAVPAGLRVPRWSWEGLQSGPASG
jgi:hemoglobin